MQMAVASLMSNAELIAALSLALNVGVALVGATWGIGKIRSTVQEEASVQRAAFDQKLEMMIRNFGETIAATRQKIIDVEIATQKKITEVELWSRDNYVRRDSFLAIITRQEEIAQRNADKLDKRLERIESSIDALKEQRPVSQA